MEIIVAKGLWFLGVVPPNIYDRINNTFEVSCYINDSDGFMPLNFYDGSSLVDENLIKVIFKN